MTRALAAFIASLLLVTSVWAERSRALTLEGVVSLARRRAPSVRAAAVDEEEARAGRAAAGRRFTENPTVSGQLGPRWDDGRSLDHEVSLSVPLEVWGVRGARVERADALVRRARHETDDIRRQAVGHAVAAYFRVLHAQRLHALAEERRVLAAALTKAASERRASGAASDFEVNLADGELARAESAVADARATTAAAETSLAVALGLSGAPPDVTGSLEVDVTALVLRCPVDFDPAARADVKAATQARAAGQAGVDLAGKESLPGLAVLVTYAHEDAADILLAGLAVTLPVFERGQSALGSARAERLRGNVLAETRRETARAELSGGRARYAAASEAVAVLGERALPLAVDNLSKAQESYTAGKLDLGGLLVVRREALDTQREYVDRLLDRALAAVDLWVASGAP